MDNNEGFKEAIKREKIDEVRTPAKGKHIVTFGDKVWEVGDVAFKGLIKSAMEIFVETKTYAIVCVEKDNIAQFQKLVFRKKYSLDAKIRFYESKGYTVYSTKGKF